MPDRRRTFLHLAGAVIALASLTLCALFVRRSYAQLPPIEWNLSSLGAMVLAVGLYLLSLTLLGIGWHLLIGAVSERSRLSPSGVVAIFLGTQIGKYVPGNVAQYAGRFELLRRQGVERSAVVVTMVLETGGLVAAAAAVAALAAALSSQELLARLVAELPFERLLIVLLLLVAILVPLAWWARRGEGEARSPLRRVARAPRLVACLGVYAAFFVLNGLGLAGLASGLFGVDDPPLPLLIGLFAGAWAAGFVAVGAPAGIGVRDFLMLATLGALWDPGVAVGLTVAHRLATVVGDGLGFPLAWLASRTASVGGDPGPE